MLANTLTLTINSVAKVLTRVNQDDFASYYQLKSATEKITLQVRNSDETVKNKTVKYDRHNVFVEWTIYATPTSFEEYYSYSTTWRMPESNDPVKLGYLVAASNTLAAAQSAAIIAGDS